MPPLRHASAGRVFINVPNHHLHLVFLSKLAAPLHVLVPPGPIMTSEFLPLCRSVHSSQLHHLVMHIRLLMRVFLIFVANLVVPLPSDLIVLFHEVQPP